LLTWLSLGYLENFNFVGAYICDLDRNAIFFAPAEQAAIPLLVRRENLMAANALFTTMMELIVGFAIGEPLLSLAKTRGKGLYSRDFSVGGLYLVAAGDSTDSFIEEETLNASELAVHPWSDLAGLRYLEENRLVWKALQIRRFYIQYLRL